MLDEILNRKSDRRSAYVGASAFAHKGGLHVSAVSKDPKTYEHIEPSLVGNTRNIIISDQAGKSNIMSRLKKYKINIDKDDPKVKALLKGYTKEIKLSALEVEALQTFTVYAGTAMTFWRHLNFNYTEPTPGLFDHYKGLKVITDYIEALPSDYFRRIIEDVTE